MFANRPSNNFSANSSTTTPRTSFHDYMNHDPFATPRAPRNMFADTRRVDCFYSSSSFDPPG